jgi:hypothetical protein
MANDVSEEFKLAVELDSIFQPTTRSQRNKFYNGREAARFVHYTSAEAALKIISGKRIWLRSTTCMADFSEVDHGFSVLKAYFNKAERQAQFSSALDACGTGIFDEAVGHFDAWWQKIRYDTYIASIAEHDDDEDYFGRLSMWRGFGGSPGRVAIVLSVPWYTGASKALQIMFSPVLYYGPQEVEAEFDQVIKNIQNRTEFLKSVGRSEVIKHVFAMLLNGVTCIKHKGFREEREWRAVYCPSMAPSKLMGQQRTIEVISGTPQPVYQLPLDNAVSPDIQGLDLSTIFDRLIIGPTAYPIAMQNAFIDKLNTIGVDNPASKVWVSDIPIRL